MRLLRRILKILIGLVFLLSSMAKLMDPVGTGLIVESYYSFFHLDFLKPTAFAAGECLSLVEATLAVMLITGVWRHVCAIATMTILGLFTIVSMLLVIFNPDMSCGCFGRMIEMTHAQTLYKNLILWAMSIPAFFPIYRAGKPGRHRYIAFAFGELAVLVFAVISLTGLPLVDYTEFAQSHTIAGDHNSAANPDEYPCLPIWSVYGDDCSEMILEGKVAVISIYDVNEIDQAGRSSLASFAQDALNAGWNPVVIAAGNIDIPGVESYQADYKKLITLNRSNGGVTFLDDGYIFLKYHASYLPAFDAMVNMSGKDSMEMYIDTATKRTLVLQGFIVISLAMMLLI